MSQNYVQSFDKLCDAVLGISDNIQSISVINRKGRAVEKKVRNGAELVQPQKSEMLLMQCALTMSMGRDFDEDLGEIGYNLVQRKNFSTISFPLDEHIVFVSSKTATDTALLIRKVVAAIRRYGIERKKPRQNQSSKTDSASLRVDLAGLDPQQSLIMAK